MDEPKEKAFELRAKLPKYVRYAALGVLGLIVLIVVVGFYRERKNGSFRLRPEDTRLSTDVVAEVNDYRRLETDGDIKKYYITADHAKTFSDNHQELENVYIEVYSPAGDTDKLKADNALYIPEENRDFRAYLKGNVNIETRDALHITTSNVVYTRKDDTAVADDLVEFERENIKGHSIGANVLTAEKRLKLLRDVEVEMVSTEDSGSSGIRDAKFKGNSAAYAQADNKLELNGNVEAHLVGSQDDKNTDVKADHGVALLAPASNGGQPTLKSVELVDNVWIETTQKGARQATIETAYAFYDKPADRFELKNGVHIVTGENDPADIKSLDAVYEQTESNVKLNGNAELTRGTSFVSGDSVLATLTAAKKIKTSSVSGNGYLKNSTSDRTTEIWGNQLNADFDDAQEVQKANAAGDAKAVVTPANQAEYTTLNLTTPGNLNALFRSGGLPANMMADGRSTIQLNAPNTNADSANKRVTADTTSVSFNDNGKDINHAEAVGNAELYVEPLRATPDNYRTTIFAPRFDCEFYPTGNNAKECVGAARTKTVRRPTIAAENRGDQTLFADKVVADFGEASKAIDTLQAIGSAKFSELDRSAVSDTMTFTQADQVVRLRGGEPTFWDSSSRAKASEMDWDTKGQRSYLRGGVSTTYYSRKKMGDAAPFGSSDKPVFATSQSLEIDHRTQVATFIGNARAWQDNNYVRADRFSIDQDKGLFNADGTVQSLLYEAKQKRKTSNSTVPVYAASSELNYARDARILQYRKSVDIRQGTDRLTAQSADVYLDENNEMTKTIVENDVVITEPGRKATGDWAQYMADQDAAVIRGNPARVDDAENGTSQSGQITVYLHDNRVISEGRTKQDPNARTRSVYKVKNTP
jgi:LPS export ABC transporter protein LptC